MYLICVFIYFRYVIDFHFPTFIIASKSDPMNFSTMPPLDCRMCDDIHLRVQTCSRIPFSTSPPSYTCGDLLINYL